MSILLVVMHKLYIGVFYDGGKRRVGEIDDNKMKVVPVKEKYKGFEL